MDLQRAAHTRFFMFSLLPQVKVLQEEKMTLLSEMSRLTAARDATQAGSEGDTELDDAGASLGPAHAGTLRYSNMRAQLDALKDELDKVILG